MVREIKIYGGLEVVAKEDYLKVVEEKQEQSNLRSLAEEEYLKVVEEKEELVKEKLEIIKIIEEDCIEIDLLRSKIKELEKQSKEKDGDIKRFVYENERYYTISLEMLKLKKYVLDNRFKPFNNNTVDTMIKEYESTKELLLNEIDRLKNLYEPEKQYEEWCTLSYSYEDKELNKKYFKQDMLLEDAFELIGMDSDNWRSFDVVKFRKEVE